MQTKKVKILILSQATLESSTDYFCKWLNYYNIPFKRLNGEDLFDIDDLNDLPNNEDYDIIWFRRRIASFPNVDYSLKKEHFNNQHVLREFINDEFNTLHNFLIFRFDLNKWVNNPLIDRQINKLNILQLAKKNGLKIPFTQVVTTKQKIADYIAEYKELILKPLSEVIFLDTDDDAADVYKMLSKVLDSKNLKDVPEKFFPSLIQENVQKKMEIRVFYLFGEFYSMAIYSQNNKNTKDDFRNYDMKRPNRNVPYKLPKKIENSLRNFMNELKFNMGSIDLILTDKGEYVFLEINPEGQFGMVSYPCNYYLEREMTKKFLEKIN